MAQSTISVSCKVQMTQKNMYKSVLRKSVLRKSAPLQVRTSGDDSISDSINSQNNDDTPRVDTPLDTPTLTPKRRGRRRSSMGRKSILQTASCATNTTTRVPSLVARPLGRSRATRHSTGRRSRMHSKIPWRTNWRNSMQHRGMRSMDEIIKLSNLMHFISNNCEERVTLLQIAMTPSEVCHRVHNSVSHTVTHWSGLLTCSVIISEIICHICRPGEKVKKTSCATLFTND